jgi:hypothetical protein
VTDPSLRLFHLFVAKFSSFGFLQTAPDESSDLMNGNVHLYADGDDLDQCLYYLRTLSNMLRWSSDSMWAALTENSISTDKSQLSLYKISLYPHPLYKRKPSDKYSWTRR